GSRGGGIFTSGTATLVNVTLSDNSATVSGGGLYQQSGSLTLWNSIVANSPSGGNRGGSIAADLFSLDSDGSCALSGGGSLSGVKAWLDRYAITAAPPGRTRCCPPALPLIREVRRWHRRCQG